MMHACARERLSAIGDILTVSIYFLRAAAMCSTSMKFF